MTETPQRSTPEARLLDAGWTPPAALRDVIAKREALRAAIARLRSYQTDSGRVLAAIEAADVDEVRLAICAAAVGEWLDSRCQRPDTDLTAWSATLEMRLIEAVWSDARAILETLPETQDASYIREVAVRASQPTGHMFDVSGRPALPRMDPGLSFHRILIPR